MRKAERGEGGRAGLIGVRHGSALTLKAPCFSRHCDSSVTHLSERERERECVCACVRVYACVYDMGVEGGDGM